jgi:hypothetical protein
LRLNLHRTCFVGKINWFEAKNSAKWRAPDLEKQQKSFFAFKLHNKVTWFFIMSDNKSGENLIEHVESFSIKSSL